MSSELFAQQSAAKSVGKGGEDKVNEGLSTGDGKKIISSAGKVASAVVPVPVNIGAALDHGGIQQGLESEGIAGKSIMPGLVGNAKGFKIREIFAALLKHRDIQDMTQGIEKLAWIDVPISSLGGLSPPTAGGMERSVEMSV